MPKATPQYKAWCAANPEKLKQRNKQYNAKQSTAKAAWAAANPESRRLTQIRSNATRKANRAAANSAQGKGDKPEEAFIHPGVPTTPSPPAQAPDSVGVSVNGVELVTTTAWMPGLTRVPPGAPYIEVGPYVWVDPYGPVWVWVVEV